MKQERIPFPQGKGMLRRLVDSIWSDAFESAMGKWSLERATITQIRTDWATPCGCVFGAPRDVLLQPDDKFYCAHGSTAGSNMRPFLVTISDYQERWPREHED